MSNFAGVWLSINLDALKIVTGTLIEAEADFNKLRAAGTNAVLVRAGAAQRKNFVPSKEALKHFEAQRVAQAKDREKRDKEMAAAQEAQRAGPAEPEPAEKKPAKKKASRERQASGKGGN